MRAGFLPPMPKRSAHPQFLAEFLELHAKLMLRLRLLCAKTPFPQFVQGPEFSAVPAQLARHIRHLIPSRQFQVPQPAHRCRAQSHSQKMFFSQSLARAQDPEFGEGFRIAPLLKTPAFSIAPERFRSGRVNSDRLA